MKKTTGTAFCVLAMSLLAGSVSALDLGKLVNDVADVANDVVAQQTDGKGSNPSARHEGSQQGLHESVRDYEKSVLVWQTSKFHIRVDAMSVDAMGNDTFRYAAWPVGKSTSEKPDIVLMNGKVMREGSGGNHQYEFTKGAYKYTCYVSVIGESGSPPGSLIVYKGDTEIMSDAVVVDSEGLLVITGSSVGPINVNTAFNRSVIQALVPTMKVVDGEESMEDVAYPVIRVGDGVVITPQADHQKLYSIDITGKQSNNMFGPAIGSPVSELATIDVPAHCARSEEFYGAVVCKEPYAESLRYVLTRPKTDSDQEAEFEVTQEGLANWILTKIRWCPHGC